MQTLGDYLKKKLMQPDFRKLYKEGCCICGTVVKAAQAIQANNLDPVNIALDLKTSPESLEALLCGDNCSPELISALCAHLGLGCTCGKLMKPDNSG